MASDDLHKTWDESEKAVIKLARQARRDAEEAALRAQAKIGGGLDEAADAVRDGIDRVQGHVLDAGDQGARFVDVAADKARREARRRGQTMAAQIARRPLESVLLAGAAGFVIGQLMQRRG